MCVYARMWWCGSHQVSQVDLELTSFCLSLTDVRITGLCHYTQCQLYVSMWPVRLRVGLEVALVLGDAGEPDSVLIPLLLS